MDKGEEEDIRIDGLPIITDLKKYGDKISSDRPF